MGTIEKKYCIVEETESKARWHEAIPAELLGKVEVGDIVCVEAGREPDGFVTGTVVKTMHASSVPAAKLGEVNSILRKADGSSLAERRELRAALLDDLEKATAEAELVKRAVKAAKHSDEVAELLSKLAEVDELSAYPTLPEYLED